MSTIFSKIVRGEIPSFKIYEDDSFFSFLDINPLTKGHTLVIPKKEVDYIFDIDDETLSKMMLFSKKISKALEASIDCNRIGMMVIGLEVPHAHIHLIPIQSEKDMNLSNKRIELSNYEFESIAEKIKNNI